MPQCVVIAGGLGSRMISSGVTTPKALLEIGNETLLEIQINEIAREGFDEILFILGNKSELIIEKLREIQTEIELKIFVEDSQNGTLGALIQAKDLLADKFLVILGDLYVNSANLKGVYEKCDLSALVKITSHPEDSDLIVHDHEMNLTGVYPYPHPDGEIPSFYSLAGVFVFTKGIIPETLSGNKEDISKNFLPVLLRNKLKLRILFHQGIIKDVGTPARILEANTLNQKLSTLDEDKLIILDRDGTLNDLNGHIIESENLTLSEFGRIILNFVESKSLRFCIATNQPIISHGKITEAKVKQITQKMIQEITGAKEFEVFICPHYPESGFEGEVIELKIDCFCRKPQAELLLKAGNELHARLTNALMIGDSDADVLAALRVGCAVIHLHNQIEVKCPFELSADVICIDGGRDLTRVLEEIFICS